MKVYIVNVNNCEAYSDYYEGNRGVYLTHQDAVDAMTTLGFDPSTKTRVIPWHDFENEKDWFESGWYDREAYRIEEWELPERTCEVLGEDYDELLEYWETELSCGHVFHGMAKYVNYCPKCGAKVVE